VVSPAAETTVTRPPWAAAMDWAMASPRPSPFVVAMAGRAGPGITLEDAGELVWRDGFPRVADGKAGLTLLGLGPEQHVAHHAGNALELLQVAGQHLPVFLRAAGPGYHASIPPSLPSKP
jgi:hypothetical protein